MHRVATGLAINLFKPIGSPVSSQKPYVPFWIFFTNFSGNKSRGSRYYPDTDQEKTLFENYKNKVIRPNSDEIESNNPSRSAKLRFVTRSKNNFFYPTNFKNKFLHYLELENRYV